MAPTLFDIILQLFSPTLSQWRSESCSTVVTTAGCSTFSGCGKTNTKGVQLRELLYADDAALVTHSETHLQKKLDIPGKGLLVLTLLSDLQRRQERLLQSCPARSSCSLILLGACILMLSTVFGSFL